MSKNVHIDTLEKVALVLKECLPIETIEIAVGDANIILTVESKSAECGIYEDFLIVLEELKAKNNKRNQDYQKRAEYHREMTRKWRLENKERHKAYQKKWHDEKRRKSKAIN